MIRRGYGKFNITISIVITLLQYIYGELFFVADARKQMQSCVSPAVICCDPATRFVVAIVACDKLLPSSVKPVSHSCG